jgi:hypothetical protein
MGSRREIEGRRLTPRPHDLIGGRVAGGDLRAREVGDLEQQLVERALGGGQLLVPALHPIGQVLQPLEQLGRVLAGLLAAADFLGFLIALGLELLHVGEQLAPPAVERHDRVERGAVFRRAPCERRPHGVGRVSQLADVDHGYWSGSPGSSPRYPQFWSTRNSSVTDRSCRSMESTWNFP